MSMRAAINAKCKDCIFDPCAPGKWRQQVEACPAIACPLWTCRPKMHAKVRKVANFAQFQTERREGGV